MQGLGDKGHPEERRKSIQSSRDAGRVVTQEMEYRGDRVEFSTGGFFQRGQHTDLG